MNGLCGHFYSNIISLDLGVLLYCYNYHPWLKTLKLISKSDFLSTKVYTLLA